MIIFFKWESHNSSAGHILDVLHNCNTSAIKFILELFQEDRTVAFISIS